MPQITLEYSNNLGASQAQALLQKIHAMLHSQLGTEVNNCKSRVICYDHFMIGDGGEGRAFVHLSVLILAGRSPDQKDQCGKELLELLKLHYHTDLIKMNLQITVHLGEMERSDYFKFTSENV